MPDPVDLNAVFGMKPAEAIAYFQQRGYKIVTTFDWKTIWEGANTQAFTVAKVMQADVLQDIYDSLKKNLDTGQTFEQWKKDLEPTLRAKGWWGKREVIDQATGEIRNVDLSNPWRLNTIYRTNTQTAFQAGRWQRIAENADNRPFLMYVAVMDDHTRPTHAAMNEKVFPFDDPIWQTCYPPNGFNCRCRVRALSQRELDRKGLTAIDSGDNLKTFEDTDPRYGDITRTSYKGPHMKDAFAPDPGWNYNPGISAFAPNPDRYQPDIARQLKKAI